MALVRRWVGARLQVQKTEDLDKEREAGLPKTTLDTELKVNAKFYDINTPRGLSAFFISRCNSLNFGLIKYLETS